MSRYAKIETFIWHDDKFRELTDDARMLFLYLLTSPHGNMCGIFYLPELYAASDLQWAPERYRRGIEALSKASRIATDGNVIWLKNHVKHNTPRGKNQILGFVNALEKVPSNSLIKEYVEDLRKHLLGEDLALLEDVYKVPYDIPLRRGSEAPCHTPSNTVISNQLTDTVTVTGSETECEQVRPKETRVAKRFDDDSIPYRLAKLLKNEILTQDPNTKVPNDLTAWATEADRMIRLDDRDPKEMAYLITWAQNHHFWQANVLSMKTFRKQYDKLKRQATQDQVKGRPNSSGETAAQKMLREALEKEQGDIIDIE